MKNFFLLFNVLLLMTISPVVEAQSNNEFQIANRLIQQQRYEDALPILEQIHSQNPEIFLFFERLVECHIQLKAYETALNLVERNITFNRNVPESNILSGQLHHLTGDTTKAYTIWEQNLLRYPNQLQLYLNTANAMMDRREYAKAIEVYRKGRVVFNNAQLFMSDIPNAYMQAGEYENAIGEWLNLVRQNPQQSSGIQRMLLRYNDPILYDIAILELGDSLDEMNLNDPSYSAFYELQIWLLLENKLYRRAFSSAKEFEERTSNYNFTLFNVGRKLTENNEFELALSAFDYYSENSFGEIKWRSEEEKVNVYTQWAKYLDDYSLDFENKREQFFTSASEILDELISQTQTYSRLDQVYLKKAELTLDFIFDLEAAKEVTKRLKSLPNMYDTPEASYLDGRIYLAQKEYTSARIALTRSNKKAEVGDLAEKTRYFLALTDFYAGDFEFAKIQLKTLGRQNTSYYANDALELRLWVQEGLAADTTGSYLTEFADAHFNSKTGNEDRARQQFLAIANSETPTPFKDDSFVLLSKISDANSVEFLSSLSGFLGNSTSTSIKERLLWERAKASDEALTLLQNGAELSHDVVLENVIQNYEELILEYPQGFYAPFARKRLNELPKATS
ncbi:MAG: tetratricopeptide repeat protein [Balneola sp.]